MTVRAEERGTAEADDATASLAMAPRDPAEARRGLRAALDRGAAEPWCAFALRAIFERDGDRSALRALYPHVRARFDGSDRERSGFEGACLWARALHDLARLAADLGEGGDAERLTRLFEESRATLRAAEPSAPRRAGAFSILFAGAAANARADALIDALLDRRSWWGGWGVPGVPFDDPAFERERTGAGAIDLRFQWTLFEGLRDYGRHDIAADLARSCRRLVEQAGSYARYDALSGAGLGPADPSYLALVETMQPSRPDPVFEERVLIRPKRELCGGEAGIVYDHPEMRVVDRVDGSAVSPPVVSRAIERASAAPGSSIEAVARAVRDAIQPVDGYARFCDGATAALAAALEARGYRVDKHWSPYLHYFPVVIDADGAHLVVDLCAHQFATHPTSRGPLLLEQATLGLAHALSVERPAGAVLLRSLRDLRYDLAQLPTVRMDRNERAAMELVVQRHLDHVARAGEHAPVAPHREWIVAWSRRGAASR